MIRRRRPAETAPLRTVSVGAAAILLGAIIALPLFAIVHDLLPSHPPPTLSWVVATGLVMLGAKVTLPSLTGGADGPARARRHLLMAAASLVGAAPILLPLLGLLRAPVNPVEQLAWTLGEEDNAQIVGVAREVIVAGPAGGDLARQYGTGAVVLAVTLLRMTGLPASTIDPRLVAIHAFTASVLLAGVVLAVSVGALVASIPTHAGSGPVGPLQSAAVAALVAATSAAALVVTLAIPMRTGFLTFVWGLSWTVLGVAVAAVGTRLHGRAAAALVLGAVVAGSLLVVRSWPFIGAAMLVPLGAAARGAGAITAARWLRARPALATVAVAVAGGAGVVYLSRSAVGEVLSYGLDALTISASEIALPTGAMPAAVVATAVLGISALRRGDRSSWPVLTVGSVLGAWASWAVLNLAAAALTGGELNYGGAKLLYGVVGLAFATAVPVAVVRWATLGGAARARAAGAAAVVAGLLVLGGPVAEIEVWERRLQPSTPPHARAMIEAVIRTSPELPIRCRPAPGTVVTERSRLAAYFCVRWVEDALNGPGRTGGQRGAFLRAPEGTFDGIVAEATAEGLYDFAYVMPLGPGWFGWDGSS